MTELKDKKLIELFDPVTCGIRAWALEKIKNCKKAIGTIKYDDGVVTMPITCGQERRILGERHYARCPVCRFLISELKITEEEIG